MWATSASEASSGRRNELLALGATEALAEFAVTVDVGSGPAELRIRALRSVVDVVGVALAAKFEEVCRITSDVLLPKEISGESSIWLDGRRATADLAAMLNATAAHALDYDDAAETTHSHPSAVIVPALLAVAEVIGSTGREVLDAFVVGYEVQTAIARGMDLEGHFRRGWHPTSSLVVLGGAAAVARLLRLDIPRTRAAIAIAASMAGGSRQNFGTMTKPFHAGLAARDSVISARLAMSDLTADVGMVEGPIGYLANFGDGPEGSTEIVRSIQRPWALLRTPLNIKIYPCCYRAARTAFAGIQLSHQGIVPADVLSVKVTMNDSGPLIHHRPTSGMEAKFSAEYVLAAALLDGQVTLSSFSDSAVNRPFAQDLLRRVEVVDDPCPPFGSGEWSDGYTTVELVLRDGSEIRHRVDIPHGHELDPLTDSEVDQKVRECLEFGGGLVDPEALITQLRALDGDEPVSALMSAISSQLAD